MISEQMREQLMAATGLTKQQVNSATAEAVVNFLMPDNAKALIQEAQNQVDDMRNLVASLRKEYSALKEKIDTVVGNLLAIAEAQEEHGAVTDEKAKNAITLYASILNMNKREGVQGSDSVESAGYVTYAYLGGQAKRDIHYDKLHDFDD